jgi:hypothetical protein
MLNHRGTGNYVVNIVERWNETETYVHNIYRWNERKKKGKSEAAAGLLNDCVGVEWQGERKREYFGTRKPRGRPTITTTTTTTTNTITTTTTITTTLKLRQQRRLFSHYTTILTLYPYTSTPFDSDRTLCSIIPGATGRDGFMIIARAQYNNIYIYILLYVLFFVVSLSRGNPQRRGVRTRVLYTPNLYTCLPACQHAYVYYT